MSPIRLRIREVREERGFSQEQLANLAGVRQATVSELERRRGGRVDLDVVEKLAAALGVEPGDLIVREQKKGKK